MKIAGIILVSIAGQSPGWPIWIKWFDDAATCQQAVATEAKKLATTYVVHSQGCIVFQAQPQGGRR